MQHDTRIDTPLRAPWLVAVWPGMGSVAAVAGSFLIDELKPQPAGSIPEREFFSVNHVDVHQGIARSGALPRSMFFVWRDPRGRHDLVLFMAEAQPPIDRGYAMCHRILDFAMEHGVQRVVTFAAMGTQLHPEAVPRVFGAVTVPELLPHLRGAGVTALQEGRVGGLNGALLAAAAECGIEAVCLLGEMPFFAASVVNPRSSARVLEAFKAMAGVEIDLTRLHGLADQVEPRVLELYEQVKAQASQLAEQGLAVFEGGDEIDETGDEPAGGDEPDQPSPTLDRETQRRIETLFDAASADRARAFELKSELDRLGVFDEFEDRFLDLFRRAG